MNLELARIEGETEASWEAFLRYVDGGPGYSLARVASEHYADQPAKLRTLETWSSQYDWVNRRGEYYTEIARRRQMRIQGVADGCVDLVASNAEEITLAAIAIAKKTGDPRLVKLLLESIGVGQKREGSGIRGSIDFQVEGLPDDALQQLLSILAR